MGYESMSNSGKNAENSRWWSRTITALSNAGLEVAGITIIVMTVMVAVNTLFRVLPFFKALNFVEEYSGYFFIAISFLGLASTLREGAHVRVTLVVSKLKPRARLIVDMAVSIVAILIILVLTKAAWDLFLESAISGERAQSVTRTPLWIPRFFLIPGYLLLILELVRYMLNTYNSIRKSTKG